MDVFRKVTKLEDERRRKLGEEFIWGEENPQEFESEMTKLRARVTELEAERDEHHQTALDFAESSDNYASRCERLEGALRWFLEPDRPIGSNAEQIHRFTTIAKAALATTDRHGQVREDSQGSGPRGRLTDDAQGEARRGDAPQPESARARCERLEGALGDAREAIASQPEDAFGFVAPVFDDDTGYYVRDALIDTITKALADAAQGEARGGVDAAIPGVEVTDHFVSLDAGMYSGEYKQGSHYVHYIKSAKQSTEGSGS